MKFEEFNPSPINNFVNQEIDSFIHEEELNSFVKYVYKIGTPKREKTYLITQIGKAFGYEDEKTLFPFAAAAELMMASAMNADDSVDDNKIRYGNETLWLTLGKDKTHIISNYIYGLLFEILKKYRPKTKPEQETHQKLYDVLMDYFFVMHRAQYSTMSLGQQLENFTLEDLEELAERKASILFEFCTCVPALLTNKFVDEMKKFGRLFGIALQYSSDVRDFVKRGNESDKSEMRWEDLYTHQPNLILVLTAQSTTIKNQDKDFFLKTWMTIQNKDVEVEKSIYSVIQKSGSVEKSKEVLNKIGDNLTNLLGVLPKEDVRLDLVNLVDRVCRF